MEIRIADVIEEKTYGISGFHMGKKELVKNPVKNKIMLNFKHLKETNMSYFQHWKHAMSCSIALFIHAWFPCCLKDYASKKISKKH
jgi:hypothetical protein